MAKHKKTMPFEFVLDLLYPLEVQIKPMFGCFSIYDEEKLLLFLRDRKKEPDQNGIWVAVTDEGFESLAVEMGIEVDGNLRGEVKKWLLINSSGEDFEQRVGRVCELIISGDKRIGRNG